MPDWCENLNKRYNILAQAYIADEKNHGFITIDFFMKKQSQELKYDQLMLFIIMSLSR